MKIRGIAHRGYPVKFPENTLSSFQAACELSFTHLELDVHLSKDGVPVIMHDYSIDRLTDGKGEIRNYTALELKSFMVKGTETIPTLEEALKLLKGRLTVSIELKQAGELYPGLEEAVLDVVRRLDMQSQVYIISFDHFSIARVRELNADIQLGLVTSGSMPYVFPFMKEIRATWLAVPLRHMTPRYADMFREEGIEILPWPIDSLKDMELVAKQYPDALITTNELERWADFYRSHPQLHSY
jgi:glycerophosphoryl diester phosphodiesterase